jgi:hypothetical protein
MVAAEFDAPSHPLISSAERLVEQIGDGDSEAVVQLWDLAVRNPEDSDLYFDWLSTLDRRHVRERVKANAARAQEVARALRAHVHSDWERRPYRQADRLVYLAFWIAEAATSRREWDLLEDAAEALFAWDSSWNQYPPQRAIGEWLRGLQGDAARIVAAVLRRYPESHTHFTDFLDRHSDARLAQMLVSS